MDAVSTGDVVHVVHARRGGPVSIYLGQRQPGVSARALSTMPSTPPKPSRHSASRRGARVPGESMPSAFWDPKKAEELLNKSNERKKPMELNWGDVVQSAAMAEFTKKDEE